MNPFGSGAKIAGYILAGGESRRFNCAIKGLQPLNEKPMIQHVIERFEPQVDSLTINSHFIEYTQFELATVGEKNTFKGPLSGLLHCMQHMHDYYPSAEWLAIVPCDAPFLPKDMISLLTDSNDNEHNNYRAQCFSYANELQPTFSIWHKDLLNDLQATVVEQQWGGLKIFLKHLSEHVDDAVNVVEYAQQTINPFFNINSEKDLSEAHKILKKNLS